MKRRPFLLAALPLGAGATRVPTTASPGLQFPRDFGAHPDARIEWWYITGTLAPTESDAPAKPPYGFQLTCFRARTDLAPDNPSAFTARQLVFAHAAVTDLAQQRLRHDQRIAREGFGRAQTRQPDTDASLGGWRLRRTGAVPHSRYEATWASDTEGFALDLQLSTHTAPLLQGEQGRSAKSPRPGYYSHYYSQPQLSVAGTLSLDGTARPVQGRAWLDHEWSAALLDPLAVGWDWAGLNLDDGGALTLFQLRRADGSPYHAGGSLRTPDQRVHNFNANDVRWRAGRRWHSPSSSASYPVEWTVECPAGRFQIKALMDNQELDSRASTGNVYWEGLSELRTASGHKVGMGYLEMTGYVAALQL